MDLRDSVSKPFKKLKHRLTKGSRKRKEGSEGDKNREGKGTNVEGSGAGQSSHLHPETEGVATSGPSREENNGGGGNIVEVNPPTSAPPISHSDPNSMRTILPVVPSLTVSLAGTGISTVPEALHPHKNKPSTVDEGKSDWKATTSAAARLFLRGVRDSADAFGPLKSVAGGLYFILENCEVRIPPSMCPSTMLTGVPANKGK